MTERDKYKTWKGTENLAAKHPMGRGVIAAAAESMRLKPQAKGDAEYERAMEITEAGRKRYHEALDELAKHEP